MTRYLLLFESYDLVFVGHPLWREDGSVFCICCWPLPVQSFSGPSLLRLATTFYCLRFETSLFVASYDSQGHGGGVRRRLHTGQEELIAYVPLIRHGPHRKRRFQQFSIVACVFVAAVKFLLSRCLVTLRWYIYRYRLMGGIYEVCYWDGLICHNIHDKFRKDLFWHSKVDGDTQTHRQHGDLISIIFLHNKERRLQMQSKDGT
jgi:hypothetical protein